MIWIVSFLLYAFIGFFVSIISNELYNRRDLKDENDFRNLLDPEFNYAISVFWLPLFMFLPIVCLLGYVGFRSEKLLKSAAKEIVDIFEKLFCNNSKKEI